MGVNKTLPDQPAPEIISGPGLTARDGTVSVHVENDTDMPSNIQVMCRPMYRYSSIVAPSNGLQFASS